MHTVEFSCNIASTAPHVPLGLEIWIDNQKLFDCNHVQASHEITATLCDDEAEHELRLVLKNKMPAHTLVDANDTIVSDALVSVRDIAFDGILLNQLMTELAEYHHNFNGDATLCVDKFYGDMGCNGTVHLKFTTPIYLWLLTHM